MSGLNDATASPASLDSYDWTWNSSQVSTSSSDSRTWCSPELSYVTSTHGTVGVYGTSGGYGDYGSLYVTVIFQAGTIEGGACGLQIACL